jgi:tetratricopeptide (TPR) repeat protein
VRDDPGVWAEVQPLYEAGRYADAADRGRGLLEAHPHPRLFYNVACCESLAGRDAEALAHLRRAIELAEQCRELAKGDSDFDRLRDRPEFQALVG